MRSFEFCPSYPRNYQLSELVLCYFIELMIIKNRTKIQASVHQISDSLGEISSSGGEGDILCSNGLRRSTSDLKLLHFSFTTLFCC